MTNNEIEQQLDFVLKGTDFKFLGDKYAGKVRDVYSHDGKLFIITTDRQSAFDVDVASIPFKGQVLTQTSAFWFDNTKDIIKNHVISVPDPNVMVCKELKPFPIEFVVRNYLTGVTSTSIWTAYKNGSREFCGNILSSGLKKNQKLDKPIITPTTKSDEHDEKTSESEIIKQEWMTQDQWNFVSDKAFKLFERGTEIAARHGLILVDTKYEFGYDENGTIFLIDEIHTPDSSRYWLNDTYKERFLNGDEPNSIDKEFLRLWFSENCDPYNDEVLPEAPKELIMELSKRYIQLFTVITNLNFDGKIGNVKNRIKTNLMNYLRR